MTKGYASARLVIASVSAAVALGTVGFVAVDSANAASSKRVTHTIRLNLVQTGNLNFTASSSVGTDKETNTAGKATGFDAVHFGGTSGDAAFALQGGLLYAHLTYHPSTGATTGSVTGGTGEFTHAKGTLSAVNKNPSGTKTAVTIEWHD